MEPSIKEKILKNALTLTKYGLNDLAWNKKDALSLINSIMRDKVSILGGDVYRLQSNKLRPMDDNWYTDPKEYDSLEDFRYGSKIRAKEYIEKYSILDEDIIFYLVFDDYI